MGLRLPVGRAFAAVRKGGPWPSRGPRDSAGCGGMRASRPTAAQVAAAVPVGPRRKNIRRGGIYPARGTSRRCGVPGTMRASSPTWVCASRSAGRLPWFVGEGHDPPAGPCGDASRADMESAPTGGCVCARLHLPGRPLCFPRSGVHARRTAAIQNRDVRNAAGCGGMRASRPTVARVAAAVPVGPERKICS